MKMRSTFLSPVASRSSIPGPIIFCRRSRFLFKVESGPSEKRDREKGGAVANERTRERENEGGREKGTNKRKKMRKRPRVENREKSGTAWPCDRTVSFFKRLEANRQRENETRRFRPKKFSRARPAERALSRVCTLDAFSHEARSAVLISLARKNSVVVAVSNASIFIFLPFLRLF